MSGGAGSQSKWIVKLGGGKLTRLKLFCFHYAGGSPAIFRLWPQYLPDVEIIAVQLPGHGSRFSETAITKMDELITQMAPGLEAEARGQFAVLGYSLGALIGFEWIRSLAARGAELPIHFVAVARSAPHLKLNRDVVHHLDDDQFIAKMNSYYRAIPPEIVADPEIRRMFLPIIRADMTLYETYEFAEKPRLTIPVTAIGGIEDPFLDIDRLNAWAQHTSGKFESREYPGGHFVVQGREKEVLTFIDEQLSHSMAMQRSGPGPRETKW